MAFLRPPFLWLLALAIPILLLHLRMRRKVRVVVPSLLILDAAVPAGAPPGLPGSSRETSSASCWNSVPWPA